MSVQDRVEQAEEWMESLGFVPRRWSSAWESLYRQWVAKEKEPTIDEMVGSYTKPFGQHNGKPLYRGYLRILARWGTYTQWVGMARLTRADAMLDAKRAEVDCVKTNQLP